MSHDTSFHPLIVLADERARRRVRAGSVAPDVDCAATVRRMPRRRHFMTQDERTEQVMANVRALSDVQRPAWLAGLAWFGPPVLCFCIAVYFYVR